MTVKNQLITSDYASKHYHEILKLPSFCQFLTPERKHMPRRHGGIDLADKTPVS